MLQNIDKFLWRLRGPALNLVQGGLAQEDCLDRIHQAIQFCGEGAADNSALTAHSGVNEIALLVLGHGAILLGIAHEDHSQATQCKTSRLIDQSLEGGIREASELQRVLYPHGPDPALVSLEIANRQVAAFAVEHSRS